MKKHLSYFLLALLVTQHLSGQDCARCHDQAELKTLNKSTGIFQKAVGLMDKGQLKNNTGNFGTLSSYHVFFTPSVQWPASAADTRQYCFGLGFMVGINENDVIETETQSTSKILDWLPPDDARGMEFSGDLVAESDDTPFMASSDLLQTWPDIGWPGYFRVDINSLSSQQLEDHPNALTLPDAQDQFSSDRDIFCTYNDAGNPAGSHGLTVEQTAYSYGRPYAEDLVFWDLKLFNDGVDDLDSIYIGLYAKFRPDFDNHDYINFIDSDNDGEKDLIYVYDLNNSPDGAWTETNDPLGIVGLRVFDTPGQIGITDFHHFSREASPKTDPQMWALMSSKKDTSHLPSIPYYFHGDDPRIDYTGEDSLTSYYPEFSETGHDADKQPGNGINYVISCGPFDLKAGASTSLSFGLIMGDAGTVPNQPDTTDLMNNARIAQSMYKLYFQGSGPPAAPTVHATAGDQKVSLYWDAKAEASQDVWNGEPDFEGYRIFRSTDAGETWGDPVTDMYGNVVGFVPLAQFDYTEEEDIEKFGFDVSGLDPAFPQNLGDNTGLQHTYIDSNLVNGVEYWYCVSAYDKGDRTNPSNITASYMNAPGESWHEIHTVRATPGKPANDLQFGSNSLLAPVGGACDGLVRLELENSEALLDHDYELGFDYVSFVNEDGDDDMGMGLILTDLTTGDTLVNKKRIGDAIDTNIVSQDGYMIYLENAATGISSAKWTKVASDTCTFDWRFQSVEPGSNMLIQEDINTFDDWRIRVDYNTGGNIGWYDMFYGTVIPQDVVINGFEDYATTGTLPVPIHIEVISDEENIREVTETSYLCEFAYDAPWDEYRKEYYSPLGWDLVPGGRGFLEAGPGWYEKHVDILWLDASETNDATGETIANYLLLFTNNKPDTSMTVNGDTLIMDAKAPSNGDEFTILTNKPFRPGIRYRFNPLQKIGAQSGVAENPLKNMIVVPDPYIVGNAWEVNEFGKRLMFSNIPSACTIKIYTLLGEHVDTIEHGLENESSAGYAFWDMRTRNDQFIAPGVYLYHAETPDGHETVGRFLVIK